uniref:Rab-GAP TBC domain-containing protein n=1 Tax=Leersia perrieri TaxID=77586 RepID=A0A0D9X6T6_9ORYZ
MFGTQVRDVEDDFNPRRRRTLWNTPAASMPTTTHTIRYSTPRKGHGNAHHLSVKFEDLYGFMVEGNVDDVNVLNDVRERMREQGRVWWALEASKGANWYLQPRISSNGGGEGVISVTSLKLSVLTNTITLRRLIRKGVPPVLRPKVWLSVSGAAKKRSTVPETYYDELIRATEGKTTPATLQIDHDLPRTFPCHPSLNSEEGQASLRRVLVGYSFRDSEVGYCQGLNYVAALLLLVMKTEEDAFWMLAVLLENVLVNDCYTDNLSGCHVEQRVFKDLLAKKCPRIAAHLEAMGFDVSLVATEWFLCLFSKTLPSETTLRVWDVLFNEGAKVLFHVALAIFKMREDDLLRIQHIGDVIDILQTTAHHLYDPDELLTFAFDKIGSMTTNTITKERKKQETVVMAELDQRIRRLSSLKMDG